MSSSLDTALLAAHETNNLKELVELYTQAGNERESSGDVDAACFYLTHAYIFALEAGSVETKILNSRLVAYGREVPHDF